MCSHPEKIAYASLRAAALGALEMLEKFESAQRPYECDCGQYHLTTKGMNGAPLTDAMVCALVEAVV